MLSSEYVSHTICTDHAGFPLQFKIYLQYFKGVTLQNNVCNKYGCKYVPGFIYGLVMMLVMLVDCVGSVLPPGFQCDVTTVLRESITVSAIYIGWQGSLSILI